MTSIIDILLKARDQASGEIKGVSGALDSLAGVANGALTVGLATAAAGFVALGAATAFSIEQALGNEKIQASLAQAIKASGGAAGITAEAANDLAQQFVGLAGGTDDAILAIETIGIRAGTISAKEMPAFIQSTLDLGAVMGDTSAAATLLARAQEDPLAALGKLQRAGIIFSEDLKEQIKTMVDAGDTAGATALLMGRVAEATGGAAAANAATLSGQWEIMKGKMGEAAETVGMALLPILHDLFDKIIAPAIPIVENMAKVLAANVPAALAATQAAAGPVVAALQPIIDAALRMVATFQESMPMIEQTVKDMAAFVLAEINMLSPTLIANVTNMLNQLAVFWREHGDEVMAVIDVAFKFIAVTIGGTLTLLSGLISAALSAINGDWSGAWKAITDTLKTFMELALSIVGTNLDEFTRVWKGNWDNAVLIVTTLWTQIKETVATKVMEMISGIQTAIINIVNWLREYVPQFVAAGVDLLRGLITGAQSMAGALIQAVIGPINDAIAAAKALLGIHSPSTVFAGIGANMMAGMAMGISGGASMPQAAMAGAVAGTTNNYYTVNAAYAYQNEGSVAAELRLMSKLSR